MLPSHSLVPGHLFSQLVRVVVLTLLLRYNRRRSDCCKVIGSWLASFTPTRILKHSKEKHVHLTPSLF